jgi:tetratricopeptide (TPR) repeat protein
MEKNAADYFAQALEKFRQRDVAGGLLDLEEAIRLDPTRWEYFWTRGAFNFRRRANRSAESDLTKAIELCPDARQAGKIYQRRMFCYGRLKRYDALIQDATWLLEHGFRAEGVYVWRGWGKYKKDDLAGAIDDYSHEINLYPGDFNRRLERAALYRRTKQYDHALDDLNTILNHAADDHRQQPFVVLALHLRAVILYYLGDFEKSFEDHNRSQALMGVDHQLTFEAYINHYREHVEAIFSGVPSHPPTRFVLNPPTRHD